MTLAQSTSYTQQLEEKVTRLQTLLDKHNAPALCVYPSPETHYRMRAEFRVWHDGDDLYHIMFDQKTKEKYRVDALPAAAENINTMMHRLLDALRDNPLLRTKLFQVDYLTALSGEMVISLLYHKPLDDEWEQEAVRLQAQLSDEHPVSIIGRARKQKRIVGHDFVIERLPVNGREYIFKHIENSFTQPNAIVNCDMIAWTLDVSQQLSGDLLELYCGAGNFSLPLATHFNRVVGTEIAKPSVQAAQYNIVANALNNVEIVRLSAEEFTEALVHGRTFKRLGDMDLSDYDFSTVLVDPPRAGLDLDSLKMIQHYDNIIYISCNPDTLHDNLSVLCQTHSIENCALFDQFPFTHHIEAGVRLKRK
ncbi:tRNA (uridine(54)-C5)-methyltransferase TrmA [Alteromonas halophila]|uniref:tRNA/tmRNA (uracil-C(5))-methyltransferase n=1 Tax=Alteromonas halophila TaxID=516698 RepID=A0A918JN51_9ALTE|nr:tRNA (uridine(54)-C5)-methyltransferase TrmA [Alteromonas halophila]GGW91665.1 tRNA/tmRNA (uracil-C(5))-methyltransferase [Alteromonas halophila]